ncbi:hexose transporter [Auricularia subglabra TFB-10046 SS5]|nr:hexose transporter [Auricularia subglabra TFB-10046 SS5]
MCVATSAAPAPNVGAADAEGSVAAYEHLLYKGKWYKNRRLLQLNLLLVLPLITSYANGFDGSMMNSLQSVKNWQTYFNKPIGPKLGLFNAIQNIGGLCGVFFAPYVADYFGRRKAIFFGATLTCVGVALQTASNGFSMFIASRWMVGFGTSFAQAASPLIISELSYPSHRPALTSIFNSLWFSGSIVAAWATFGSFRIPSTWSWRLPSLLQGLPSIIQVFLIWLIPESPRWLVNKGRDEEAIRVLTKWHAFDDPKSELVQFEYNEIKQALQLEKENKKSISFFTLFSTPGNLRRMRIIIAIGFFSQWSGNGLISYYLNIILKAVGIEETWKQTLLNGFLQIFNLIVAISASLLTERLGRRTLFLWSTGLMLVFYSLITATSATFRKSAKWDGPDPTVPSTPGNSHAANAFIAFIFLYNFAYAIAYTPLIVSYTVEILPYTIRAKGLAVMNLSVTASLVFNQYINPIAWDALNWKYYLVYVGWLAFEFVYMYLFCVETKGRSLEECSLLFDRQEGALHERVQQGQHDQAAEKASIGKEGTATP